MLPSYDVPRWEMKPSHREAPKQNPFPSTQKKTKPSQTKSTDRHRTKETTRKKHKECTQIRASRKRICSDCSPQRSRINNQYKTKAAEEKKKRKKKAAGKRQDRAQTHQPWRSSCRWNLMQEERIQQRRASERQSVRECTERRSCVAVPPSPSPYPSVGLSPPSGR